MIINRIYKKLKELFSTPTYNFLYWLFFKPWGIIAIRSVTFQYLNRIQNHNLGDDLNFYLLREITGKKIINYDNMRKFCLKIRHYTCIGSVFEWEVDSASIVWGTGIMFGGDRVVPNPKKICAVRGPLTRKILINNGISCPEIYGDPALLLPLVYNPHVEKKYQIGLIPHFIDYNQDIIQKFHNLNKSNTKLIQMQGYKSWKEVICDICSCDYIVSSSLHGMIIADAYNIPNTWIQLSDNLMGEHFKFHDYFASVGRKEEVPLDFRNKDIDLKEIVENLKKYQDIKIDIQKIIDSCPLISKKRKAKLEKTIPHNYSWMYN